MADFDPTDYDGGVDDLLGLDGGQEEEGEGQGEGKELRDAILVVIDASDRGMARDDGRGVVAQALAAAVSILKRKVVTSPDDRVGVLLYGVREKQNPNGFEGIRLILELDRPSAQRIRQLEVEASRTKTQFIERYGQGHAPLSDVFWTCTTVFNLSANPKQFQPRVFLFTSNDAPCATVAEQDAAVTRAQDLMDLGVDVEFFPLVAAEERFFIERFWSRVLPVDSADYVAQAALQVEELHRRVRRRLHRKRTLQRLSFRLSPGIEIAMAIFAHIIEAKVPYPVYLLNENNKPLKSETKSICQRTGAILHPVDDIESFIEVAGERVYLSREEVNEAKRIAEPGLQLLGFKAASRLRPHHRIFHSYFVTPMDRVVKGSGHLCAALIDLMLQRKLMAIARFVRTRNAPPQMVALLPQAETEDAAGADQLRPAGFHMILLPWAEEIRRLEFPLPTGAHVPPQLASSAQQVVRALRLEGFAPACVDNPVLQKHYAAVQALALGEEKPEETDDPLQPDEEAMREKAPVLEAWRVEVDTLSPALGALKRPAPGAPQGEAAARRPRVQPDPTSMDMRELVASGEVERLTVSVLRDWLKTQGAVCTGKKAELVERCRALV